MNAGKVHIICGRLVAGVLLASQALAGHAQGGDKALREKADALFDKGEYAAAAPLYSQLVSLSPQDYDLNFRFGTTTIFSGEDKSKAIGYLKFATQGPSTNVLAWYFLGRAYQLDYRFDDAIAAYQHFKGTADKKLLAKFPVDAMEQQCRNGKYLLSNLKDIEVLNKVEVASTDFFRFYDLSNIGGKIVVTPEELLTSLDRKNGGQSLVYLPTNGGPIYFSSFGKEGKTGKDIYRTELLPSGGFSTPVKLAGYINTDQDEDYAVMAPDGKTFYFCSKGHNSMGGYDVFKSSYDKGMDTFSAPENMDFAVNTPADELLYIVGPDGKEACFASDRDSKQGMVNVYRVGTRQTPINITIFKGTYASAFDANDRKAHIVVEDGQTRERVADVKTDINGSYLLALPHGGTYKFLVEGGPSGLAHFQSVDVPPNENPKVYRQEIQLLNQGGEQLVIKNYFDEPLDADVMALAMDEIKRRAKLDITGSKAAGPIAQQKTETDPLQTAGFDGTQTLPQVEEMAARNASGLNALAKEQGQQSNTAYEMALRNVADAEQRSTQAKELVKQAEGKAEGEKTQLMRQAAEAKQLSHEANERAKAAYRTAVEMDKARMGTQQRAAAADKVASAITQAHQAGDNAALTAALVELKAAMDKEKGPQATLDEAERTRRAATEAQAEATRKLNQGNAQRDEESQLRDRVNRLARDIETAKGGRKQDLVRQHDELSSQLTAMHEEVEEQFAKARSGEVDAALARGQAALVRYLGNNSALNATPNVAKEEIAGLAPRMASVRSGNEALVIGPQYGQISALSAEEMERRTFDWKAYEPLAAAPRQATQTVAQVAPAKGSAGQGDVPATTNIGASEKTDSLGTGTDLLANMGQSAGKLAGNGASLDKGGAGTDGVKPPNANGAKAEGAQGRSPQNSGALDGGQNGSPGKDSTSTPVTSGDLMAMDRSPATVTGKVEGEPKPERANDQGPATGTGTNTGNTTGQIPQRPGSVDQQSTGAANAEGKAQAGIATHEPAKSEGNVNEAASQASGKDEQAFLLANKLAELEQLRHGEKDKRTRDSLDAAIKDQRALIETFKAGGAAGSDLTQPIAKAEEKPVEYRPLDYDPASMNEQLAEEAFPGFAMRRKTITDGPGSATDKANMLHALEMDLVDSIDARMSSRVAQLDAKPERADSILPELDRWRQLKAAHVQQAADELAKVDQTYAASETKALEDSQITTRVDADVPRKEDAGSPSPHNDAYIAVEPDLEKVYSSALVPRSRKDREAIDSKNMELARGAVLQAEIDSMEQVLVGMPAGKGYDKLRERTDRKIDDLLISNVDLGQRTAFISRSEFDALRDSAGILGKALAKKGLPPDEPLVQMIKAFQGSADAAMVRAKEIRKGADRSEDALKRNSEYRQAYAEELGALRDMDRSLTVSNWLLGGRSVPGEALSYEEIEARMFPEAFAAARKNDRAQAELIAKQNEQATVTDTAGQSPSQVQSEASRDSVPSPDRMEQHAAAPGPVAIIGRATADSVLLSGYLDKYYYLSPSERAQVMGGDEERKYFLMKGGSMEKQGNAEAARNDAEGSAALANSLKAEAAKLRSSPNAPANDGSAGKATLLETRADGLQHRADSLMGVSKRLQEMASTDDAQAAALMQAMAPGRSAAIMGLEQGKRRTDPVLARTRPDQAVALVHDSIALKTEGRTDEVAARPPAADGRGQNADHDAPMAAQPGQLPPATPESIAAPAPFTGPLTKDLFAFSPASTPRTGPIAIDAPMPSGIVFKVQVGAFRKPLQGDAFSDMAPLAGESVGNGLVRYTAGLFTSAESAAQASAKVRARGYRDAFVAAYMDGKRVPLREAMKASALRGATNSNATPATTPAAVATAPVQVATVQLPEATATESVLANYPATADAVLAEFKPAANASDYYNDPKAAPAKQVEVVKGLFFTVQVGVYSKPTPLDKLFNITPLNSERTPNDKIRYTTGIYLEEGKAVAGKGVAVTKGVTDAFVTAYLNGKRIPVRDARALLGKFGKGILADPALATP